MNREIKFRAWDKKGRFYEMANVKIIDWNEKYVITDQCWNEDHETGESDCVANFDEIELMQYTGLKDKNEKKIYEGDILKVIDRDEEEGIGEVCFGKQNGCWCIFGQGTRIPLVNFISHTIFISHTMCLVAESNFEVLGNKFENPELLEKK